MRISPSPFFGLALIATSDHPKLEEETVFSPYPDYEQKYRLFSFFTFLVFTELVYRNSIYNYAK